MKRKETLETAIRCVCGQREKDYGKPEDTFEIIADLWRPYVRGKHDADVPFSGEDVAAMIALLKIGRIAGGQTHEDNWVDLAGYAACGCEIQTEVSR